MADRPRRVSPRRRWGRFRHPTMALAGVIVLFVLLTSLIALQLPAWEAPDEAAHVDNVETLVGGRWYRIDLRHSRSAGSVVGGVRLQTSYRTELHQPPLYYLMLAAGQKVAGPGPRDVDPGPIAFPFVNRGLYLHHRSADHRFVLPMRLVNVLFGVLTVWLTFLTARLATSDRWVPVIAAAVVAFVPRQVFLSSTVTNDNLVTMLGALLAYVALRSLGSPTRWRFAVVGAVVGLLVLTKLSALPLALVVVVLVFVSPLEHKGTTGHALVARLETALITSIAAAAVSGWYLVQNVVRYGDPLARHASQQYLAAISALGTIGPYRVEHPFRLVLVDVPERIWQGFWYTSGAGNQFRWPWPVNLVVWVTLAFLLAGLLRRFDPIDRHALRFWPRGGRGAASPTRGAARVRRAGIQPGSVPGRHEPRALAVLGTLTLAGLLSVWLVAFSTASYEARLAFGGLPSLACLAALGGERRSRWIQLALPVLGLAGTLVAIQQHVLAVDWLH
jgi:hypothetical protein